MARGALDAYGAAVLHHYAVDYEKAEAVALAGLLARVEGVEYLRDGFLVHAFPAVPDLDEDLGRAGHGRYDYLAFLPGGVGGVLYKVQKELLDFLLIRK